jgi:hypothetical protein
MKFPWVKRRRRTALDNNDFVIELVPGPTPYFWIGGRDGSYLGSINADKLAEWIDDLRTLPPYRQG